jgi:hypothetical protein
MDMHVYIPSANAGMLSATVLKATNNHEHPNTSKDVCNTNKYTIL